MLLISLLRNKISYEKAVYVILLTLLVGLAFSIRILVSLSTIMLVLSIFLSRQRNTSLKRALGNKYFLSLFFLYLIQIFGLFYTSNVNEGLSEISKKAGIIAIPFFFAANGGISPKTLQKLMIAFSIALVLVSSYCLIFAFILFSKTGNSSVFFYHQLVQPVDHHAIFFSLFLFYNILYWMSRANERFIIKYNWIRTILVAFFFFMIILLSSKLIIIASILHFILYILKNGRIGKLKSIRWSLSLLVLLLIATMTVVFFTNNPIKRRFGDIAGGNARLFEQKKFSPDIYFNGLQFRLLTWRFSYEILNEKNAWGIGVSPGNAQDDLNLKYIQTNMYLGQTTEARQGFWNFNCHNLYLQTILESGLIGLFFLLLFIIFYLKETMSRPEFSTLFYFMLVLAFGFTESLLSSQYTILLFLFFPLLSLETQPGRKIS